MTTYVSWHSLTLDVEISHQETVPRVTRPFVEKTHNTPVPSIAVSLDGAVGADEAIAW